MMCVESGTPVKTTILKSSLCDLVMHADLIK